MKNMYIQNKSVKIDRLITNIIGDGLLELVATGSFTRVVRVYI